MLNLIADVLLKSIWEYCNFVLNFKNNLTVTGGREKLLKNFSREFLTVAELYFTHNWNLNIFE